MKRRYEHLNAEERATIMVMKGQNAKHPSNCSDAWSLLLDDQP